MHNNYKSKQELIRMQAERIFFLKSAITQEPEEPFYQHALAMEYVNTNVDEAEKIWTFVLKTFPTYLPSYYQAANLYFNLGKNDLAESTFLAGIKLAELQHNAKAIKELKGSYQSFKDEIDE
jgi:tetratricopeptide (TPR) repeat protein